MRGRTWRTRMRRSLSASAVRASPISHTASAAGALRDLERYTCLDQVEFSTSTQRPASQNNAAYCACSAGRR